MLDFADFPDIIEPMSSKYLRVDLLGPGDLFRLPDQGEIWAVVDPVFDKKMIHVLAVNRFFEARKFAPYFGVIPMTPGKTVEQIKAFNPWRSDETDSVVS